MFGELFDSYLLSYCHFSYVFLYNVVLTFL